MKILDNSHLCYCLNNLGILDSAAPARKIVSLISQIRTDLGFSPDLPFAAGLWLNSENARRLSDKTAFCEFRRILDDGAVYVFSLNAFPFGHFQSGKVKEDVYLPDWRSSERLEYTKICADLLSDLLPKGVTGSISTVPGAYLRFVNSPKDISQISENLSRITGHLARIESEKGKKILLAIEPEPDCLWESGEDFAEFFAKRMADDEACRNYIGVCHDCSHHELVAERPGKSLAACLDAGVKIAKVQLSAALGAGSPESKRELAKFADERYLHQTRLFRKDGSLLRFPDLPEAIERGDSELPWKIHYHIPIHLSELPGGLKAEKEELDAVLGLLRKSPEICTNLEIETYTYSVLPGELGIRPINECMVAEYSYILNKLSKS